MDTILKNEAIFIDTNESNLHENHKIRNEKNGQKNAVCNAYYAWYNYWGRIFQRKGFDMGHQKLFESVLDGSESTKYKVRVLSKFQNQREY